MYKIILVLILIVASYFLGFNTLAIQERVITQNITNDKYIVNGTECIQVRYQNISKVNYEVEQQNITIDLRLTQKQAILNLKPKKCNNIGCSEGYFKAKYDLFDILNIDRPKFSERPSSGGYGIKTGKEYNETLPVYEDGFGKYIELNASFWHLFTGGLEPFNKSIILLDVNSTYNMSTLMETLKNTDLFFVWANNDSTIKARKI